MMRLFIIAGVAFFLPFFSFVYGQNTDSTQFYFQKGLEEKEKGRKLESVRNFEKAISFSPEHIDSHKEIANGYMGMNRHFQAREAYVKLVNLGEKSIEVLEPLVELSYQMKQWDDLVKYAQELKAKKPDAKVSYYLGKMYFEKGDYGQSIPNLQNATKEDPTNAEAHYLIGHSYMQMLNYKKSIPFYTNAIQLKPNAPWIYELALIYNSIYDDKNSLKYMIMAAEHGYPKNAYYLENLGMAYIAVGDTANGFSIMRDILKMRPSDLNILNTMAEAYYDKLDFKKAIDYWDQVMFYDDNNPKALYMIGMSYQRMGQKEKGIQLIDRAIQMDPSLKSLKHKKSIM